MKGPMLGYGCLFTQPSQANDTPIPDVGWAWQPYADVETWWNDQPAACTSFPLLFGGIETPQYLVLVVAAGETSLADWQDHPFLQRLGNFVVPPDRLTTFLRERLSRDTLALAEQAWAQARRGCGSAWSDPLARGHALPHL